VSLQIENGVEGLIVGGTTGEGQLMTWDEHIMLIAHTVNFFGDKIKVIGTSCSYALFLMDVQKKSLTFQFVHG
jgi:4-hydroxy-tetrahydrodipicolinate synthase